MRRLALILLLLNLAACNRSGTVVLVKVLYNPQAPFRDEISSKLQAYSKQRPQTSNHKDIEVHEAGPGGAIFDSVISGTGGFPVTDADIVVLDPQQKNMSDKVKQGMATGKPACTAPLQCVAFIGPWIPADRKEAAEDVFRALTEGK
jgi:hypothetical protein